MDFNSLKNKKVLIVGIGRTGFALIRFFHTLNCEIRVTDMKPIFDLNKAVKKLKKFEPSPHMTFGEHKDEDFLEADVVVYSPGVNPKLPQLELARAQGKIVCSEFSLSSMLCKTPIIAVCGSYGRTTMAHMIGFALRQDGKKIFIGGTSDNPFIDFATSPERDQLDYVVVELSAVQSKSLDDGFKPAIVLFGTLGENFPKAHFKSVGEYLETKLSIIKRLGPTDTLVVNFDKLANNAFFRNANCQKLWYSRRSFVDMGVMNEVQGTHFHERRIHSNINYHSQFIVSKMRVVGTENRENLLAAVTVCKSLNLSDAAIQATIEKFPGIPHRLEFVMEKNGVMFCNDSKAETMPEMIKSVTSFKTPVILVAGGKDDEELNYEKFGKEFLANVRVLVLVGESKERMNRVYGDLVSTYIVGSFEESILLAYQKSRTGDTLLLSPGNPSTDFFRDYEERGNYFKKLLYQL